MREWRDLKLAVKLARLLPQHDEKPKLPATDGENHPMADRWLDQPELVRSRRKDR